MRKYDRLGFETVLVDGVSSRFDIDLSAIVAVQIVADEYRVYTMGGLIKVDASAGRTIYAEWRKHLAGERS